MCYKIVQVYIVALKLKILLTYMIFCLETHIKDVVSSHVTSQMRIDYNEQTMLF